MAWEIAGSYQTTDSYVIRMRRAIAIGRRPRILCCIRCSKARLGVHGSSWRCVVVPCLCAVDFWTKVIIYRFLILPSRLVNVIPIFYKETINLCGRGQYIFFCSERLSCSNISYLANNSPLINYRQSINFNDERMKTTTDIVIKHEYSREFWLVR